MAKSVVGGANASVASAFARLPILGSFMVHAASARTGSVPHLMKKPATTVATVTVGLASVMKAGLGMPAMSRRSVTYPKRRAKSCAKTHRGWCAPTEAPATVVAVCVTTETTEVW